MRNVVHGKEQHKKCTTLKNRNWKTVHYEKSAAPKKCKTK